ncbi:MAG: alanine racemase [Rhodomicrobiaceae bacterium]
MGMPAKGIGQNENALSEHLGGVKIAASETGVLAVDLDALRRNYRTLAAKAAKAECAAVVKGNGYGLGSLEVAEALIAEECRTFFVATLGEAEKLALSGTLPDSVIYVLDGLPPGSAVDYAARGVRPVLGDLGEIEEWASLCQARDEPLAAALHVDSGMNRLGLKAADQKMLIDKPELLDGVPVSLIMSHLACADVPDHPKNAGQRDRFTQFAAAMPAAPLSLANSAGVFLGPDYHFDVVRPGIALYGGNPYASLANPMEPVVRLYGRILQVGDAAAGETVGYGAMRTLTRPSRYATVAVGYADGYFRALGSSDAAPGAIASLDGQPLPILGRVSMDLIVFDVTDLPHERARRGGFVELIGPNFTVDEMGSLAGSFSYEMLTSLGPRYARIYLDASEGEQGHG